MQVAAGAASGFSRSAPCRTSQGCETIRIVRDQDDPDHVAGFTRWTERRNFDDYLTWRTERGFTGTFEAMLTRPFVIRYYDIASFGEGIAARQSTQP